MAKIFEQAGFNALHIDAGAKPCPYWGHPAIYQEHGCLTDLAAQVKKAVKIPVITVGKVNIPELAERVIAEGKADLIAMARGLLADPYWPMKVREGKEEEIRPCISCGDGCTGRVNHAKPMSCAVNPACGRERIYQLVPAERPKKLMVVGGGIAGMEVARVAATRGHRVTLFEKGEALGGHLIEAAVPDFKRDVKKLLEWYERQLSKLGIEIKFRTEVSTTLAEKEKPDAVCVATGSKPIIPDIPGIGKSQVMTCIDALLGKRKIGSEVAIVGGGLIGCETALWLAQQGKKVTILEMLPQLMSTRYHPDYNRVMLIDLLEHLRVAVSTGVRVQEVIDTGVILLDSEGKQKEVKVDTVILAVGLKPDDRLYKLLAREAAEVHAVGDCQEPINVMKAIWDAYEVGRCI
jgi:2-enoate reductase